MAFDDTQEEVSTVLLEKIKATAESYSTPLAMLRLAEAYAWIVRPAQDHGGSVGGKN